MPLVTKKYIYEAIVAVLEGSNAPMSKKFEQRQIESFMMAAINKKLKTEYLSVTLPSDETIPEGLVLACYDSIEVDPYKTGLSRAKLPAMPVSLRRNMGVFFVGPADAGNVITTPPNVIDPFVIIEGVAGGDAPIITGTVQTVTGFTVGSSAITCVSFVGKYAKVIRGSFPIPSLNTGDGTTYFTKVTASNVINLSQPLADGEYVKIEAFTLPSPTSANFIIVEAIVDGALAITGLYAIVTGYNSGSFAIVCDAFAGKNVDVTRGSTLLPGVNPGDGSDYYTKVIGSNTVTFSRALVTGEYIKIETL